MGMAGSCFTTGLFESHADGDTREHCRKHSRPANRVVLFDTQDKNPGDFDYNVSPDGQRFLISRIVQDDNRPVNISLDWLAAAKH